MFIVKIITPSIIKRNGGFLAVAKKLLSTMENVQNSSKVNVSERLTKFVKPVNYRLKLDPQMSEGTFRGHVNISIKVKEERKFLAVHTKFLDIKEVKILKGGKELPVSKFIEVKLVEQLLIYCDYAISVGDYNIVIDYTGSLTNNHVGFYASKVEDDRMMVASKFEPTYAREAFPCFDEPDFKATYDITLVKPASYIALSNMPQISSVTDDSSGAVAVTFAKSVPMSTYLACFVICDFVSKEVVVNASGVGKNFVLRAFSQKGELQKIDFSLDIGKRATEFYIQYYEVPFPLPKLDMIAIPDYVSGATEHWGLITYRETSFLVDPAAAASSTKLSVANTVAHELAHMWFGNLVTMKWWNDLWLNEGFATYMQVKSLNALEPSWTMLDQFLTRTMHPVLVTDAKLSSHPIVQTVDTPDQITAIFDAISYNKGASVLRMVEGFVGEENFRQGVSAYLRKYEFGNTVTQDLLNVLEPYFQHNNPKLNLSYIMDTWTRQMGYPVLTVTAGDNPGVFVVKQSRFLLDSTAVYKNDTDYNYRWFVPITYKTSNKTYDDVLWFADSADHVKITLNGDESWLKINNNQVGYYRVNYPVDMWVKLIEQLKAKSPQLTISDRANLLNDAFALAEARHLPYPRALELATWLPHERDFVPWETAAKVFGGLASRLLHSTAYDDLQRYVQTLVKPIYQQQVWEEQDFGIIQGLLRARILSMACKYGLTSAEAAARGLFTKWLNSHDSGNSIAIEPDLRDLVYSEGMKVANKAEWEKMWHMYLNEKDVQEQRKLRTALSAPRDTTLLRGSDSEYEYDTEVVVSTPPPPPPQPKSQSARKKKPKIVPATVPEQLKRKAPSPSSESSAPTHSSTNRFLTLAWNESYVRSQDYLTVVGQISHNPSGTALVWDDVRGRWPELVQRFSLNSRYLGGLVPTITGTFNTQLKLHEMESFFEQYPDAGAGAGDRKRALETVRNNIQWSRDNEPAVAEWLKHFTEGA